MISYLEMAQRFPVGAKVDIPVAGDGFAGNASDGGRISVHSGTSAFCGGKEQREVVGYEYCNGKGYLLFDRDEKWEISF